MNQTFCAAPWRGLHINPRGDVKTCCAGDPNMLGNLNEQSIESILHGPVMQEIRQTLRSGNLHEKYCYNCIQAERYGRSERDWHNRLNPEFNSMMVTDLDHVPVLVDVRWNTTCNLSCNYCAPACSSRWANLQGIPVKSGTRPYYEQVCNYLNQHRDSIREVALVGGEPLLLPENERLLDVLHPDCTVTLITNLSVNFESNKIFQKLSKRNRVGWSMSFDNTEQRFEYVRHGGTWNLLTKNLDRIQALFDSHGHWGGIHAVYNIYNATRLIEFTKFARDRSLSIHWQSLYQPGYLDPQRLGATTLELALDEIDRLLSTNLCQGTEREFFQTVKENLKNTEDLTQDFSKHIDVIETTYHTDQLGQFKKLWPELEHLCI